MQLSTCLSDFLHASVLGGSALQAVTPGRSSAELLDEHISCYAVLMGY